MQKGLEPERGPEPELGLEPELGPAQERRPEPELGLEPAVEAHEYTIDGLVQAICAYYQTSREGAR